MKWEAHTRTAERILTDFDAYHFKKYEKDLINGIIYPDSNDLKPHFGRDQSIKEYIRKARDMRLDYNASDSFFYLGMAFHYIQDSWVGMDPDHEDYDLYMKMIDKCDIVCRTVSLYKYYPVTRNRVLTQYKELEKRLEVTVSSIAELYELATSGKPFESTAFLDLNFSYRVCFRVAEMVLKPMLMTSLDEKINRLYSNYFDKLTQKEQQEQDILFNLEAGLGDSSQGVLSGIDEWRIRRDLNKRTANYEQGKHLDEVLKNYCMEVETLSKPYQDWYNITVPKLELPKKKPLDVSKGKTFPIETKKQVLTLS
jgi:hypothetical protein